MDRIAVHYHRPGGDYAGWSLWTWEHPGGANARALRPSSIDTFGAVFLVRVPAPAAGGFLPFHPDSGRYDRPDRIWEPACGLEVWIKSGVAQLFTKRPSLAPSLGRAYVDGWKTLTVVLEHAARPGALVPSGFVLTDEAGREQPVLRVHGEGTCVELTVAEALPHCERRAAAWQGQYGCRPSATSEPVA